jgi:hypothetical protein
MGPLFSLALIAVASIALFEIMCLAMRMLLNTARRCDPHAVCHGNRYRRCVVVRVVALVIGTGVTLMTKHRWLLILLRLALVLLLAGLLSRISFQQSFVKERLLSVGSGLSQQSKSLPTRQSSVLARSSAIGQKQAV